MGKNNDEIPRESMEYIVSQIRTAMDLWNKSDKLDVKERVITYSYSLITYTFEDIFNGGTVKVSFYTNNNSFNGLHSLFTGAFSGNIFGYTSRFEMKGHSYDLYV